MLPRRSLATLCGLLLAGFGPEAGRASGGPQALREFEAPAAKQGVAVGARHFYAVDDRRIERYEKATGAAAGAWQAGDDPRLRHLDSGLVHAGRLYCAHSNYPAVPMRSSIEVFDADSLRHLASIPLPGAPGSATWIDRHAGRWWVAFAHYRGRGGEPGRGPEESRLLVYDDDWRPEAVYRYPEGLVERFAGYSNSGGSWGPDGRLYLTGHDAAELYVLALPAAGDRLQWLETLPAPIAGQGIAWDRSGPAELWGVVRASRRVLRMTAPRLSGQGQPPGH
jgi:hypothetical protein